MRWSKIKYEIQQSFHSCVILFGAYVSNKIVSHFSDICIYPGSTLFHIIIIIIYGHDRDKLCYVLS